MQSQQNGSIIIDGYVKIASITDGTSNTFIYGEKAHGYFAQYDKLIRIATGLAQRPLVRHDVHHDLSAKSSHIERGRADARGFSYYYATDASSYHAGGLNFAFCDGSVRFIKNSISSWTFLTGAADTYGDQIPDGTTFNASTIIWGINPGSQLGVYQALSTRNGGEVISSDSY